MNVAQCPDLHNRSSNPGHTQMKVLTCWNSGYGLWSTFLVPFIISCILCAYPFRLTCPSHLLKRRPHVELVCLASGLQWTTVIQLNTYCVQTCHQQDFYSVREMVSPGKKNCQMSALFTEVALKEQKHIGKFLYLVFLLILVWMWLRLCSVTARTITGCWHLCLHVCLSSLTFLQQLFSISISPDILS